MKNLSTLLTEALSRYVTVEENGNPRRMRIRDVIIQGIVNDAARRDAKAVRLLFALIDRYGDGQEQAVDITTLRSEDEAIIMDFIESVRAQGLDKGMIPTQGEGTNSQKPAANSIRP